MIKIREFTRDDIPQVADVHRDAMATGSVMTPALLGEYERWLTSIFIESPMRTPGLESLVCEGESGQVVAFFGIVARQVTLGGKVLRASVASNFCARPASRGGLGLQVAREYIARSGDLAFIDRLTDRTRRLWDHVGMVAMPQSVRWTIPLRPLRHVLAVIGNRLPARAAATPIASAVDALATRVPRSPFRHADPQLAEEVLTGQTLARLLSEFGTEEYLRPLVTDGSTVWLVECARAMKQYGELQMMALRDAAGGLAGWYLYYAKAGAPADVLQLVSTPAMADRVLAHLCRHALARGVVSLTGTMDPTFLSALGSRWAVILPAPTPTRWMMVYSTKREVLEAFWRSKVLLSQLDGEWFQQFR